MIALKIIGVYMILQLGYPLSMEGYNDSPVRFLFL